MLSFPTGVPRRATSGREPENRAPTVHPDARRARRPRAIFLTSHSDSVLESCTVPILNRLEAYNLRIGSSQKTGRLVGRAYAVRPPFIQQNTTNTMPNTSKPRLRGRLSRDEYCQNKRKGCGGWGLELELLVSTPIVCPDPGIGPSRLSTGVSHHLIASRRRCSSARCADVRVMLSAIAIPLPLAPAAVVPAYM